MDTSIKKIQLKGLDKFELTKFLMGMGQSKYRGSQIFNWIYNRRVEDFSQMHNIPKILQLKLDEICTLKSLYLKTVQISTTTKTKKLLFETEDGEKIESVLIPTEQRNTLCISTQVGCPLNCKFCATGLMGFTRNLTAGEIVDQYLLSSKNFDNNKITNIVYMGMGEPLLNFNNTVKSLRIFTEELNKSLSRNKITVSTVGIVPKIKELADTGLRVKLALSLHSCFNDIRSRIIPVNIKYPVEEITDALIYYEKRNKIRITFEYIMLKGINDRKEDIKALTKLMRKIPSKINLIPFNSIAHVVPEGTSIQLKSTSYQEINEFADELRNNNLTVMIRETQGDDIAAACGQLAIKY